jgi:subtilase family serine protease
MAMLPSRICILLAALVAPLHGGPAAGARVVLAGDVHPALVLAEPVGRPDPAQPMARMILALKLAPEAQARLATLLGQQQDPKSALYHQWLTPDGFGAQFGAAQKDLDTVVGWLEDNAFTVEQVSPGRTSIQFSGDIQKVEQAFQTLILDYRLGGQAFHANAIAPSIPGALAGVVQGVVSLHNLPRQAMNSGFRPAMEASRQPLFNAGASHYLAPGDFSAIYDVKPLYAAGIDGTGSGVAIVGRTHIPLADITAFRAQFGLPVNNPVFVVNGQDPGDLGSGEDTEADLDVEWAGAVARNAAITFVVSQSTASTDGVDLSAQYIVDHNLAPVMSTSFGQCEAYMGASETAFYNNLWAQAAAQGITALVASGDSGAAGCGGNGQGVSGLASSPYNVAVGGTEFNESGGSYWAAGAAADGSSALGYIPETAWNESGSVAGGSGLWATGGGASSVYPKPAWQAAPGVPADGRRDLPDVALAAAGHDGYLIRSGGGLGVVGGTSCSSPAFAGLMALVVQATGQRQGNANAVLYRLGNAQFKSGGPAVFHDILTGGNSVPGTAGYLAGPGYDLATGLGSVDAHALVSNWSATPANKVSAAIVAPSANLTVASGATVAFAGSATDSSTSASLGYAWGFGDGATGTGAAASHTFSNLGTASVAYAVTLTVKDSTGITASATRTVTVTPQPRNTLTATITAPAANLTAASGAPVAFAGSAKDSSASAALSYAWSFGDGATGTGAAASHAFSNLGNASVATTVTLTVKDSTGITATATRTVTVTAAPAQLTAAITLPAGNVTVPSGAVVAFTGVATDTNANPGLSCNWTAASAGYVKVNPVPLTSQATLTSGCSVYFTNISPQPYTVVVTFIVTDNRGAKATVTRLVTVSPAGR